VTTDLIRLLEVELESLDRAMEHLDYSYQRCMPLTGSVLSDEELERFEALTSRFARVSDILVQKLFRIIDQLDLDDAGTARDRINRAEKKGMIARANEFVEIRQLRNVIAHEYEPEAMQTIFASVLRHCPSLFDAAARVRAYAQRYTG